MINRIWPEYTGAIAIGAGALGASIYLLMINVTLAHIEAASGHIPFDMRPMGYGPADAKALLDALGAQGGAYYLTRQIPLDTIYPAMLAMFLIATMRWFGNRIPGSRLVRIGILFSVGAALFDYGENLGIAAMIWSWPNPPAPLIYAASTASIFKSALTTLAVFSVLLIGIIWARHFKAGLRA